MISASVFQMKEKPVFDWIYTPSTAQKSGDLIIRF
jgi:hypothetical protein